MHAPVAQCLSVPEGVAGRNIDASIVVGSITLSRDPESNFVLVTHRQGEQGL